jgi:L-fuculose-phosphate aldolase
MDTERGLVVDYCKKLITSGLTKGTGGNISVFDRDTGLMAISPSGMDYFVMMPEDVVVMDLYEKVVDGLRKPSVEYSLHAIFYKNREDVNAVVHTHAIACSTMAALHWTLPAVNYLVAMFGSNEVPCAEFAIHSSEELAQAALKGMGAGNAVFLANHGFIAAAPSLPSAFYVAEECERCSDIYLRAKSVGEPKIVPDEKIKEMRTSAKKYGQ